MPTHARYSHTNLIARDWRQLAHFYQQALGCVPIPPERDLNTPWLGKATGVPSAALQGIHLRLPGHGPAGPTLEIFQYQQVADASLPVPSQPGYGHIAFGVDDVPATRETIVALGGRDLGEIVTAEIDGAGQVTFVYLRDPEGNIIELQSWENTTS